MTSRPPSAPEPSVDTPDPKPYISTPAGDAVSRAKWLVTAAVVAVLAIAGAAVIIASNDSDGSAAVVTTADSRDTDTVSAAASSPVTTVPATISIPDTVVVGTTTTAAGEPSTTATAAPPVTLPAVPDGAVDLGLGVFIPVPGGWTSGTSGSMVQLTDGSTIVAAQTLVRTPGTDPALITQEYVNAFDAAFETVSYSPTARVTTLTGANPADIYATYFVTFDSTAGLIQSGYVNIYVRGDGLALVYSVYGPDGQPRSFPSDAGETMNASFVAAPAIGPATALVEASPFRVATAHDDVVVDGLVAFSAAPGFSVISEGGGTGFVTNSTIEDVQVDRITGQADTNAVTATAQAILEANYTDVAYTELLVDDADVYGVFHGRFTWTGTFVGGQSSTGIVDFYYDPASTNALVAFRSWFTQGDGGEPFVAASQFMLRSLTNSFTTVP